MEPSGEPDDLADHPTLLEDEVLASWMDVLVADGLVPSRAVIAHPL